jgi:hypothetical protein
MTKRHESRTDSAMTTAVIFTAEVGYLQFLTAVGATDALWNSNNIILAPIIRAGNRSSDH